MKQNVTKDGEAGLYAWTATVGTKGQIVIPKEARELFQIEPGDTLILLGDRERGLAIPRKEEFSAYVKTIFTGGEGKEA